MSEAGKIQPSPKVKYGWSIFCSNCFNSSHCNSSYGVLCTPDHPVSGYVPLKRKRKVMKI